MDSPPAETANQPPQLDVTPARGPGHAVLWACFLGCSWTWVIGMFFPVLLLRDYGFMGWVVFAIPNVVGAAAMGWVLTAQRAKHLWENHQVLHCSFPNTSPDPRISLTFGFHRRASVLGAHGALSQTADEVYDEARIERRASVLPVAIDARAQHFAGETRFDYLPFAGRDDEFRFNAETQASVIHDYNLYDLSI